MSDKIAIRAGSTPSASLLSASSPELAKCIVYVPCRTSRRKRWRYSSATSLSSSTTSMLTHIPSPLMCSGLLLAGQADRKLGEFALLAVDVYRTTMLLGDNVIGERQTKPGAFPSRLCRQKRLEQFVPDFGRDAGAVVAHPNFNSDAEIAGRHHQRRPKVRSGAVALPFGSRIKAVTKQVQKHPGHLLRRQLHRR